MSNSLPQSLPRWKKELPMWLTWSRFVACPPLVACFYFEGAIWGWIAAILFMLASLTDYFDGSLARKYGVESNLGRFMDPIADKALVTTALVMLITDDRVGPILVLLLVVRDILIGGIRSVAAADNVIIDAKPAGKWKTALQMGAIPALLLPDQLFGVIPNHLLGGIVMWISVILSVISGAQYVMLYYHNRKN